MKTITKLIKFISEMIIEIELMQMYRYEIQEEVAK